MFWDGNVMAYWPVQPDSALISSPLCPVTAGHVEAGIRLPSHLEQPDGRQLP